MTDLSELHGESFAHHLQTDFKVDTGNSGRLTLRLAEVKEPSAPPHIELFSLIFKGPATPRLPQRTYAVEHEKMGAFNLFLTAVAAEEDGINYEAVFHRVRKKES